MRPIPPRHGRAPATPRRGLCLSGGLRGSPLLGVELAGAAAQVCVHVSAAPKLPISPASSSPPSGMALSIILPLKRREQAGLWAVFDAVALAADVDGGGVVQEAVQDRRGDDGIAEGRPPSP